MKTSDGAKAFHGFCTGFLCILFFGLPLVLNKGYFNATATKSLFFLITGTLFCAASLFCVIAYASMTKKNPLRAAPLDWAFVAFSLAYVISASLSTYGADVWLGRSSRIQGAAVMLLYALMYYILSCGILKINAKSAFFAALILSFVVVSVLALLNSFKIDVLGTYKDLREIQRPWYISTIGNVNFFSAYLCLCLPLLIVLSALCHGKLSFFLLHAVLVLGGISAVLTCSEGFALGMSAFVLIVPFFFFDKREKFIRFCISAMTVYLSAAAFYHIYANIPDHLFQPAVLVSAAVSLPALAAVTVLVAVACVLAHRYDKFLPVFRWVYLGLVCAAVAGVALLVWWANTHDAKGALEALVMNDDWGTGRGTIYRLCAKAFRGYSVTKKLFGIGPETLQWIMAGYNLEKIDQAHCEYLQTLMTCGIFGLVTQLSVIGLTVFSAIKTARKNPYVVALLAGLLAYWAQACVSIAQPFTNPIVFAFMGLVCSEYKNQRTKPKTALPKKKR